MKFKLRNLLLAGALMLTGNLLSAQLTTKISGVVKDNDKPVKEVEVIILEDGQMKYKTKTNEKGEYTFPNIEEGNYSIFVWKDAMQLRRLDDIKVRQGETMPIAFNIGEIIIDDVHINANKMKFKPDEIITGASFDLPMMTDMGVRQPTDVAVLTPGVTNVNGALSFRGARTNATAYYMDGVKLQGPPTMTRSSIKSIFVVTGGVPAEFGDFTGGVISVTTRNPGMRPDSGGFKLKPKRLPKKVEKKETKEEMPESA